MTRPSPDSQLALLPPARQAQSAGNQIKRQMQTSLVAAVLLFGVGGAWASLVDLSGAVIAPGFVIVESNSKAVQHLTGGIVDKVLVRDGSQVKSGDLLVRLDETQVRAQLQIMLGQIDEALARQARLDAERSGQTSILLPATLAARQTDPAVNRIVSLERIVLDSRTKAFAGQRAQLDERIVQINLETEGLDGQLVARRTQVRLINNELRDLEQLFARNLVPLSRVSGLRREVSRLTGDVGSLVAEMAKARARIAETELQIIQIDQQRRSDVTTEARDTASRLAELQERRLVLEDQLNRIEIRSPSDGVVHQLATVNPGGVVRPGEVLMRIVPTAEELSLEVRVQPRDIDQVWVGQQASIRLAAANQPTIVNIEGTLAAISPDLVFEPVQQQRYFVGRVKITRDAAVTAGVPPLKPGMPVDVFIRTGDRTALSFLLKPLVDQASRAFRER